MATVGSLVVIPERLKHNLKLPYVRDLEPKIPKIIHQTYKSLEQLPEIWKDTPDSWKRHHPTWEYKFWGDKEIRELVVSDFPDCLEFFDGYPYPIQRADAFRPFVLYKNGGIYADCDLQATRSFDDLFLEDKEVYLIRTPAGNCVTNCLMASKPGAVFWKNLIEIMRDRYHNPSPLWLTKHFTIMSTTGPLAVEQCYQEYPNKEEICMLPRELIVPTCCNICMEKPCRDPGSYTKLLEGSSWTSIDTTILNFFFCRYPYVIFLIVLLLLLRVFYKYYKCS